MQTYIHSQRLVARQEHAQSQPTTDLPIAVELDPARAVGSYYLPRQMVLSLEEKKPEEKKEKEKTDQDEEEVAVYKPAGFCIEAWVPQSHLQDLLEQEEEKQTQIPPTLGEALRQICLPDNNKEEKEEEEEEKRKEEKEEDEERGRFITHTPLTDVLSQEAQKILRQNSTQKLWKEEEESRDKVDLNTSLRELCERGTPVCMCVCVCVCMYVCYFLISPFSLFFSLSSLSHTPRRKTSA